MSTGIEKLIGQNVMTADKNRGVTCGRLVAWSEDGRVATLDGARMCIAWRGVRGLFQLAATGPTGECRITPAVKTLCVADVHMHAAVSDEAMRAWEAQPWG